METNALDPALLLERVEYWLGRAFAVLTDPESIAQFVVIAIAAALSVLLARLVEPALESQVRRIRSQPRLLRILAVVLRRLRWILLALTLWLGFAGLAAVLPRADRDIVWLAAALVSGWVAIAIASRIVRNRAVRNAIAAIGWTLLTLELLGLLDPLTAALDARALTIGTLRLSIVSLLKGVALLAILLWLAGIVGDAIQRRVERSSDLTPSVQVLLGKFVKIVFITVAVLVSLSATGLDLTAITVFSGAVGLGLGFGLQTVVSNFISGIIILLDKSIKPGDVVAVEGTVGWIRSLRARFVSVVTRDGREILVPNEDFITEKVVNWSFTDTRARIDVAFGVSYDSDPHEVRRLARAAAAGVRRVIAEPAPVCHITGFGDSSVDFLLRFWIEDAQNGLTNVRGDVFLALWDAFKAAGIEIPFPQRVLRMETPLEVRLGRLND